jgi:hypothetical protein
MSFRVEIPAYVAAGQGGSIKRGRKSYAYSGGAVIVATRVEADDIAAHMPDGRVDDHQHDAAHPGVPAEPRDRRRVGTGLDPRDEARPAVRPVRLIR